MVVPASIEPWLQPIAGPSPGGSNARFDPRHEAVRAQVAELDSPAGKPVDWKKVVDNGGAVLAELSKDYLIASYLAHGLFHTGGLAGLAAGTQLLTELLDRYWDSGFPEVTRVKGRVAALTWFVERTGLAIADLTPSPGDRPGLEALDQAAQAFAGQLRARFSDPAPPIGPLSEAVARLLLSLPGDQAAPAAPPSAPAAPAPAPAATAPAPIASGPTAPGPTAASESPLAVLEARVAPYLAPIRPEAPAGENAKFDPRHEAIRTQVAKLDSPSGGTVDWASVQRDGLSLIQETSKDLLIGAYVAFAGWELDGIPGLTRGLLLLGGLHDQYWETAFPEVARLKGRANALSWLFERAERMLAQHPLQVGDGPAVEALNEAYTRLSKQIRERYEGQGPALGPLKDTLARLQLSVPQPAAPAPPPSVAPSNPLPAAPSPPVSGAPAVSLGGAPKALGDPAQTVEFLREVGNALVGAGKTLRAANSTDPQAYRLLRVGLWLPFLQSPPAGPNGNSTIPPPPAPQKAKIDQLLANQKWAAALEEAESLVPQGRLSLDLQRAVAQSLQGLGESHAAALAAVQLELRHLLGRLSGLEGLRFADGTPSAGAETKAWLGQLAPAKGGSGASISADPAETEAIGAAAQHAGAGQIGEAVKALEAAALINGSGAARFRLRLEAARLAFAAGRKDYAEALYTALGRDSEAHDLDRWDPVLAKAYLSAHLACLSAKKGGAGVVPEKIDMLYSRLARLDPIMALEHEL